MHFERIWEDLIIYLLLAWVYFTYSRMYRRNTITQPEYRLMRMGVWVATVLVTLDVLRRLFWYSD